MERKEVKISLGGFIGILIIAILLFTVIGMGMYIKGNDNEEEDTKNPSINILPQISKEQAIDIVKSTMQKEAEQIGKEEIGYSNIRVKDVEIQAGKIEAKAIVDLKYSSEKGVWERIDDVQIKNIIVKEGKDWKTQQATTMEEVYNEYIAKTTNNTRRVENSTTTEWHNGYIHLTTAIQNELSNFEADIKITSGDDDIYLEINNPKLIYTEKKNKILINEVKIDDIKETMIGLVTREQELYAVALVLTNEGELYYGSGYLTENNKISFEQLIIDSKIQDIRQAWYGNRRDVYSNYSYNIVEDAGLDVLLKTEEGRYYSFENYIRGII